MSSPQFIANDIFASIRTTFELIRDFQSVRPFSNEEQAILVKIGATMPVLFEKIVRYYEQDEQAHAKAFQLAFSYPGLFDKAQPLEIIIAYMYGVLKGIQQRTSYMFFADFDHAMYVEQLVNAHKSKIQQLVNAR